MPEADAQQLLARLSQLPLTVVSGGRLLSRALEIGVSHNLAVYDAIFVALAEKLACPLITVDGKQSQASTALGIATKPIVDFQSLPHEGATL